LSINERINKQLSELESILTEEIVIPFPEETSDALLALAKSYQSTPPPPSANLKQQLNLKDNEAVCNLLKTINWNDNCKESFIKKTTTNTNSKSKSKVQMNRLSPIRMVKTNENQIIEGENNIKKVPLIKFDDNITDNGNNESNNNLNKFNKLDSIMKQTTDNNYQDFTQLSKFNIDYIKKLSDLISSVVEPKLMSQLAENGLDLSSLPGGINFDLPIFEETKEECDELNKPKSNDITTLTSLNKKNKKLNTSTYKKLKEKVNSNKDIMWFTAPPERKKMSIIFEYTDDTNSDDQSMTHEIILEEANKYLSDIDGSVQSLQFIPRSVQFGSVYINNFWILTLNDTNAKFYTIKNGLKIKDRLITCKSYDEFIFSEYEKFIRNEKYKEMVKNHERLVNKSNNNNNSHNSKSIYNKFKNTNS
jgi:hypothetical protein